MAYLYAGKSMYDSREILRVRLVFRRKDKGKRSGGMGRRSTSRDAIGPRHFDNGSSAAMDYKAHKNGNCSTKLYSVDENEFEDIWLCGCMNIEYSGQLRKKYSKSLTHLVTVNSL